MLSTVLLRYQLLLLNINIISKCSTKLKLQKINDLIEGGLVLELDS
jgi:hypothetical protein